MTRWAVVDGDIVVDVEEAEWWGASLAVLVAALHHPQLLEQQQPETDAVEVARDVLNGLEELRRAAPGAATDGRDEATSPSEALMRRAGQNLVLSPGTEVANLALCLEIFAVAVLDPHSPEASIARGATAYAASAWSNDICRLSGALP